MILGILIALGLVMLAVGFTIGPDGKKGDNAITGVGAAMAALAGAVALVLVVFTYDTNTGFTVFHDSNAPVYAEASEALHKGVEGRDAGLLDAANLMQVEAYAKNLKDQRWAIVKFNRNLAHHRLWEDSLIVGWFVWNVDDRLQPISLTP